MAELVVPGAAAAERLRRQITSDGRTVFFPGVVGGAYDGGVKLLFPLVFNGDGIASAEDSRRRLCSFWGFFFCIGALFTGGGFCAGGFLLLFPFDFGRMEEVTMKPMRLLYPLLLAAVGGEAERNDWTIRFVFGWVLSRTSVLGLLSFSSVWLHLHSGSCGWEMVHGRLRCQIMEPTADGLLSRISCSLPMFGVRSMIWNGEDGGWMDRSVARASGERQRQIELRKKHSWGLCVIFQLLRILSVSKRCTALLFNI
ncbi:hypothetical protein PVAP13_1NG215695 [Panicum virgatum]|uniref:Uncharacterized protein n=1 Tax=Panicum virgatum TaxID=38727 RepID=A0A8T0X5S5_PANVG|nr:hypothetical protein PVAP13_1NG215695 [Panicum virgatum]